MNKMEITIEFNKIKEISEIIIKAEYTISEFFPDSDRFKNVIEELKFKCLKYELFEIDELDKLSRSSKQYLLDFCGDLKQYLFSEFVDNISNNPIETDKYFRDFYEVYKAIILTETVVNLFMSFLWELQVNQLKYACLKHKLYDPNELENLSNIEEKETMLKYL